MCSSSLWLLPTLSVHPLSVRLPCSMQPEAVDIIRAASDACSPCNASPVQRQHPKCTDSRPARRYGLESGNDLVD